MTEHAKRGRKPGTGGPRDGSFLSMLEPLAVGEWFWIETTADDYPKRMRQATMASRFPIGMKDRRFSSQLFTAVSNSRVGDTRILLRIERIA